MFIFINTVINHVDLILYPGIGKIKVCYVPTAQNNYTLNQKFI